MKENIYRELIELGDERIVGSCKKNDISINFAYKPSNGTLIVIFQNGNIDIQYSKSELNETTLIDFIKEAYKLEDYFISVIPKQFYFNNQKTTDTILFKEVNGEKQYAFINREFPPYGFALAGGMVDKGEDSLKANFRELKEELNATSVTMVKDFGSIKDFEIRGSLNTRLIIVQANNPEEVVAGDDATSFIWLNEKEIKNMINDNKIIYHHRKYIEKGLEFLRKPNEKITQPKI